MATVRIDLPATLWGMLNVRRTTFAITATALLTAAVSACSSTSSPNATSSAPAVTATTSAPAGSAPAKAAPPKDATAALAALTATVTTAKAGTVVTEANDPNHLLGRPGQYTSKVTFTDTRIQVADIDGLKPDDVERGGAVEVFATPEDAKKRADYIQGIVKNMPALLEYDFVHGSTVVRVSKFLTSSQAGEYDKAGAVLG